MALYWDHLLLPVDVCVEMFPAVCAKPGLSGYISNGSWREIPRTCYWHTVEVWQVRPTGKPAARCLSSYFWDVPHANIHAAEDIGAVVDWLLERCDFQPDAKSNLAVLHNRNDMTNLFRASNWSSSPHDSIVSRGSPLVLE